MITDKILEVFLAFITWAWGLVPVWDIDFPFTKDLAAWLTRFNGFAPVTEVGQMIGLLGTLLTALMGLKLIFKIIGWVRGSG